MTEGRREARELRELARGAALEGVGVWIPRGALARGEGLWVQVEGPAIAEGIVECTRARARPFGATVAPWEAAGWERGFARDADHGLRAWLRAAHAADRGAWVSVLGLAGGVGRGAFTVTARSRGGLWARTLDLTVVEPLDPGVVSSWFEGWGAALSAVERELRTMRRTGIVEIGASFAWRAVRDRTAGERSHRARLAAGRRLFPGASARSLLRAARRGAYAMIELRREPGTTGDDGSYELTLARRRGSSGLWGVELVRRTSVGCAR
jgi:hypothetical protein